MSRSRSPSPADIGDRHRRYLAFGLLALGLLYAFAAAEHFTSDAGSSLLEGLQIAMSLTMAACFAPIAWWKIRASRDELSLYTGEEGFVQDALSRAHIASWTTTFILAAVAANFDRTLAGVPGHVQLRALVAVMLIVFSVTFLFLSRDADEEPFGDVPVA